MLCTCERLGGAFGWFGAGWRPAAGRDRLTHWSVSEPIARPSLAAPPRARPAVLAGLDDGVLVHDEPAVGRGVLPVDQPHQPRTDLTGSSAVLDRHAAGEQLVDSLVLGEGVLRLRAEQPGDRLLDHARRQVRIDAQCRLAQASGQDDLVVRRALGRGAAGASTAPGRVA